MTKKIYAVSLVIGIALFTAETSAYATSSASAPVPLYGFYNTYLDHSKQTFNGRPDTSQPSTQDASFTTVCDAAGCVAHWLRLTELAENPKAPSLFDYHWINGQWESTGEYPFHCNNGSQIITTRFDFIKPNSDGSFSGERTFTVRGAGCPGQGPGKYWLPFTLTPRSSATHP